MKNDVLSSSASASVAITLRRDEPFRAEYQAFLAACIQNEPETEIVSEVMREMLITTERDDDFRCSIAALLQADRSVFEFLSQ